MYNNKFFKTLKEAKDFQREHGGSLYSATPKSKTKRQFMAEKIVTFDARMEVVDASVTPYCVAWNEVR